LFAATFHEDGGKVPRRRWDPRAFSDPRLAGAPPEDEVARTGPEPSLDASISDPVDPGAGTVNCSAVPDNKSGSTAFIPADAGRPSRRIRERKRAPRNLKEPKNETTADTCVDAATGRRVLVDPETKEPVVGPDGEMVYDPPLAEVFPFILYHGLQSKRGARLLGEVLTHNSIMPNVLIVARTESP